MRLRAAGVGLLLAALVASFAMDETSGTSHSGLHWTRRWKVVESPLPAPTGPTCIVTGKLTFSRRRPQGPIVVFLERVGGELPSTPPKTPYMIRQRGARFDPEFAAVERGREVTFVNDEREEIDHNVYFTGADKTDLGIFPRRSTRSHIFRDAGEVRVFCSVHSQMDGKIFISPNRHFTVVSPEDDTFEIVGIPTGRWVLRTWQTIRRFHEAEVPVTLEAGEPMTLTVGLTR